MPGGGIDEYNIALLARTHRSQRISSLRPPTDRKHDDLPAEKEFTWATHGFSQNIPSKTADADRHQFSNYDS
ncbi:MAG: hypothetical protein MZV63_08610 [Marinilabiliales bacterium]|nr:hypothetical protein [Marinilabiliales bacterium]